MPRKPTTTRAHPAEFRRKIVELFKGGRSVKSIADEYGMARRTVAMYVKQDDIDSGVRSDGLTSSERDELTLLRRENKRLKIEAEILSKAAAWFARETDSIPTKPSDS
jgi:transposase